MRAGLGIFLLLNVCGTCPAFADTTDVEKQGPIEETVFVSEALSPNAPQGLASIFGAANIASRSAMLERMRQDDLLLLGTGAEEISSLSNGFAEQGIIMRQLAAPGRDSVIIYIASDASNGSMLKMCRTHLQNMASPAGLALFMKAVRWCSERLGLP